MKIGVAFNAVESNNVKETIAYEIQASPIAFKVLGDTLYSNKVGSVVRELAANALDAHRMVGKEDQPFLVKLPGYLDSTFVVRDYGPGIPPHEIQQVYTKYFASTKRDTNNLIGGFGLGAKVPFSLVDSFMVINYHDGVAYTYAASMDVHGPSFSLLHTAPTTETGLEVSIAVPSGLVNDFERETRQQLRYFTIKPNVECETGEFCFYDIPQATIKGDGWELSHQSQGIMIVVDQVGYKLGSLADILPETSSSRNAVIDLSRVALLTIRFPTGVLEVNASREDLAFSEKTKTEITKRITAIMACLPEYISKYAKDKIVDTTDYWEAVVIANIQRMSQFEQYVYHSANMHRVTWNGEPVVQNNVVNLLPYPELFDVDEQENVQLKQKLWELAGVAVWNCYSKKPESITADAKKYTKLLPYYDRNASPNTSACVIYNDNSTALDTIKKVYPYALVVKAKTREHLDNYLTAIRYSNKVLVASQLGLVNKEKKQQTSIEDLVYSSPSLTWQEHTAAAIAAGGLYIVYANNVPISLTNPEVDKVIRNYTFAVDALVKEVIRKHNKNVFYVRKRDAAKLAKQPNMVEFFDYVGNVILPEFAELAKNKNVRKQVSAILMPRCQHSSSAQVLFQAMHTLPLALLTACPVLADMAKICAEPSMDQTGKSWSIDSVLLLLELAQSRLPDSKDDAVTQLCAKFRQKYAIIEAVVYGATGVRYSSEGSERRKIIYNYFNLVNQCYQLGNVEEAHHDQ